jgi:hypothetical protein
LGGFTFAEIATNLVVPMTSVIKLAMHHLFTQSISNYIRVQPLTYDDDDDDDENNNNNNNFLLKTSLALEKFSPKLSMSEVGFEPTISAGEQPQTYC